MSIPPELQAHLQASLRTHSAELVHSFARRAGVKPGLLERLKHLWSTSDSQVGIVISPDGLALKQGALLGYSPWCEITAVSFREHKPFQLSDPNNHLTLSFPGCDIHLPDIYTASLDQLHLLIASYWQNATASADNSVK